MTGILDEIQHFNFTGAGLISCLGQWAGCLLSAWTSLCPGWSVHQAVVCVV